MSQSNVNTESRDIWSAESYSQTVAPFVPTLTDTVQAWLDPQPSGNYRSLHFYQVLFNETGTKSNLTRCNP